MENVIQEQDSEKSAEKPKFVFAKNKTEAFFAILVTATFLIQLLFMIIQYFINK